eukprot:SAG22_NODE_63_length_23302_cov_17.506551_16_plen_318_part_00
MPYQNLSDNTVVLLVEFCFADGGVVWEQGAAEQGHRPFTGRLAAPMFLQHEPGKLPPLQKGWIHAYFAFAGNLSFWNNNDAMLLGRVRPDALAHQPLSDSSWEFFCALAGAAERWCSDEAAAVPVFQYEKMVGENVVTFHAETGRYLFANFGFYNGKTGRPRSWFSDLEGRHFSQLSIFESAMPWGPWNLVHLEDDWRGSDAGYTPTFPSAWLRRTGDVLQAVMVHSGWWDDYNFAAVPVSFDVLPAMQMKLDDDSSNVRLVEQSVSEHSEPLTAAAFERNVIDMNQLASVTDFADPLQLKELFGAVVTGFRRSCST